MTRVAAAFARAMAHAAGLSMTEDGAILSGGVVVRRLRILDRAHVAEADYLALITAIRESHQDRATFVMAYAEQIRPDALGVLGLAIKTAPTLRASLRRLERYSRRLADSARYRLAERPGGAALILSSEAASSAASEIRTECALAGAVQTMQCIAGPGLQIEAVSFRHACAGDADRYAGFFGCPVRFGRGRDEIVLPAASLDQPNRLGDHAVCDFLTRHLDDDAGAGPAAASVRARLLHHIADRLEEGPPQAGDVARRMGMSERTLYRRLSDEGVTYRDVLHEAQIGLARRLLADGACSIAEIACRTGFAEQSTFTRAFKRRVGHTPARYRRHDLHA